MCTLVCVCVCVYVCVCVCLCVRVTWKLTCLCFMFPYLFRNFVLTLELTFCYAHSAGFVPLIGRGLTFCDATNTQLYNDPSTNATLNIVVNVLKAVAAAFPDALFHLGGDETLVIPGTPCDYNAIHSFERELQVCARVEYRVCVSAPVLSA